MYTNEDRFSMTAERYLGMSLIYIQKIFINKNAGVLKVKLKVDFINMTGIFFPGSGHIQSLQHFYCLLW